MDLKVGALKRQAFAVTAFVQHVAAGGLQSQGQARESNAEALKMSYLTSAADVNLIPTRLPIVSTSVAISDDELKNLARGDIRLILTRHPDLKRAISSAFGRGSVDGIDEMTQLIDPAFAASLSLR